MDREWIGWPTYLPYEVCTSQGEIGPFGDVIVQQVASKTYSAPPFPDGVSNVKHGVQPGVDLQRPGGCDDPRGADSPAGDEEESPEYRLGGR